MKSIGLKSGLSGITAVLLETNGESHECVVVRSQIGYTPLTQWLFRAAACFVEAAQGNITPADHTADLKDYLLQVRPMAASQVEAELQSLRQFLQAEHASSSALTLQAAIRHSTHLHAQAVKRLLPLTGMRAKQIDVIGYPEHVLYHREGQITVQIGDAALLAELTGITVVTDFQYGGASNTFEKWMKCDDVFLAQEYASWAVKSLRGLPLFGNTAGLQSTLSGHAYRPPAGGTQAVKKFIKQNPAVLYGYRSGPTAEMVALIARHQASEAPPEKLLTTESPHPRTVNLSHLAQNNLPAAYDTLIAVDQDALSALAGFEAKISKLANSIYTVLNEGRKIIISGCGSAGRAATVAEILFRAAFPEYSERVIADNAGGDLVIIRAAEGFEDQPEYGKIQLQQVGWQPGDLYIGVSASGAAGFVHGQIEYVVAHDHKRKPILIVCNAQADCEDRFRQDMKTIFHPSKEKILNKVELMENVVGEMSLMGSTRMQAGTAQLASIAFALLQAGQRLQGQAVLSFSEFITALQNTLSSLPIHDLSTLTAAEVETYQQGNYTAYRTGPKYALTINTDTTERSPTFNVPYCEHDKDPKKSAPKSSPARIIIRGYSDNSEALCAMLGRKLRVLNWDGTEGKPSEPKTTLEHLLGYDLTENIIEKRKEYMPDAKPMLIDIDVEGRAIKISFADRVISIPTSATLPAILQPLYLQLILKMVLNTHSTLVAGRMGCYQGNLMTSVRASNEKLINRALALVASVLGIVNYRERCLPEQTFERREIAKMLYLMMQCYQPGQSIVFNTAQALLVKREKRCYAALFDRIQRRSEDVWFEQPSEAEELEASRGEEQSGRLDESTEGRYLAICHF